MLILEPIIQLFKRRIWTFKPLPDQEERMSSTTILLALIRKGRVLLST